MSAEAEMRTEFSGHVAIRSVVHGEGAHVSGEPPRRQDRGAIVVERIGLSRGSRCAADESGERGALARFSPEDER